MTKSKTLQLQENGVTIYSMQRFWEVQKPPYRSPLPYSYLAVTAGGSYSADNGTTSFYDINVVTLGSPSRDHRVHAQNKAYNALSQGLGSASQMANNLLEAHQSVSMIVSRAKQLGSFANSLRKGNLAAAGKALGAPGKPPKGLKGGAKSLGDQFLEYHFGWQPLFQDMYNAAQTLSKPDFGIHKVSGHGHDHGTYRDETLVRSDLVTYHSVKNIAVSYAINTGCYVKVSNPNANLASQLGLVNPLAIAWEAVPFSFVADWIGNIGQCLSAMTDFVGFSVLNGYTTTSEEINVSGFDSASDERHRPGQSGLGSYKGHKITVSRGVGVVGPTLSLKPFNGLSITRGATAISLLLQQLR